MSPEQIEQDKVERFRLRVRVKNHIKERLAANKSKKDKSIFLSDDGWKLVVEALEKLE